MKFLCTFDEGSKGMGFPSMKEFFMNEKYEYQDDVVEYLKTKGKPGMVRTMRPKDYFTGEPINVEYVFLDDGVYAWTSPLAYYVEKYNLKLPDDFIEHVLKMTGKK